MFVERCFGGSQDEVDDFYWRVDDPEGFGHFGEGDSEEVAVEVFDYALSGGCVVLGDAFDSPPDRVVEPV